jgi:hypothetical protein
MKTHEINHIQFSSISKHIWEVMCARYILWTSKGACIRAWPGSSCYPSSWWPGPNFSSKIESFTHKEAFLRKVFAVTKMHAIDHFMSPRNFRSMSCLVIEKHLFFQTLLFISEVLSLCHRDGHIKSLILTNVGNWNCFDLLYVHIPSIGKN